MGYTFPDEKGGAGGVETRPGQNFGHRLVQEVDLDVADVVGNFRKGLMKAIQFDGERGGMIDLEDDRAVELGKPVRAAVEAGAKNHDLGDSGSESIAKGVVDEFGAGDSGGSRAGQAQIGVALDQRRGERKACDPSGPAKDRAEEVRRKGIVEEPALWRARGFEGAKVGHVLGGATRFVTVHGRVFCTVKCGFRKADAENGGSLRRRPPGILDLRKGRKGWVR